MARKNKNNQAKATPRSPAASKLGTAILSAAVDPNKRTAFVPPAMWTTLIESASRLGAQLDASVSRWSVASGSREGTGDWPAVGLVTSTSTYQAAVPGPVSLENQRWCVMSTTPFKAYELTFGDGTYSADKLAQLLTFNLAPLDSNASLLSRHAQLAEVHTRIAAVQSILRDERWWGLLGKELRISPSQPWKTGRESATPTSIRIAVDVLSAAQPSEVRVALAEFVSHYLALAGVLGTSEPFTMIDHRVQLFPTLADLQIEALRMDLTVALTNAAFVLEGHNSSVQYSTDTFFAFIAKSARALVTGMETNFPMATHVLDGLRVMRFSMEGSPSAIKAAMLTTPVLHSPLLASLRTNFTLVSLALEMPATLDLSTDVAPLLQEQTLRTLDLLVKSSPRWKQKPLEEVMDHLSTQVIEDPAGNLRAVVLSASYSVGGQPLVVHPYESIDARSTYWTVPADTAARASMFAPKVTSVLDRKVRDDQVEHVLGAFPVLERNVDHERSLLVFEGLPVFDILPTVGHIAALYANSLTYDPPRLGGASRVAFVYSVAALPQRENSRARRVYAGPLMPAQVFTSDPMLALLIMLPAKSSDSVRPLSLAAAMPDIKALQNPVLTSSLSPFQMKSFRERREANVSIRLSPTLLHAFKIDVDVGALLGIPGASHLAVVGQPWTAAVAGAALRAPIELAAMVHRRATEVATVDYGINALELRKAAARQVYALLKPLFGAHGVQVIEQYVYASLLDLLQREDAKAAATYYTLAGRPLVRRQMQAIGALYALLWMGLLSARDVAFVSAFLAEMTPALALSLNDTVDDM